jgi:hypothetical protein
MPLIETKGAASAQGFGLTLGGAAPVYIEDVFSTWLYTGSGSTQTINNGIDLSTKGGLVWIKDRSSGSADHFWFDTNRGIYKEINSNTTDGEVSAVTSLTAFNTNGFSLGGAIGVNFSADNFASWTFRKQQKFFDVVTYTGNGSNRTISHNLGSVPGCIIVKRTDTTADWQVYHRSLANTEYIVLNSTVQKATGTTRWNSTTPTSTVFSLGTDTSVNANGGTYVAYLFAHDAGGFGLTGTDNVITCGSYTGNGSTTGPVINLGYEPQWLLIKNASDSASWLLFDTMRGIPTGSVDALLLPNTSGAETANSNPNLDITATGFYTNSTSNTINASGNTYIYIAIRRGPMKTPTTGTSVFNPVTYTGTNADNRLVNTSLLTDMTMARIRTLASAGGFYVADRLRGNANLGTAITDAENTDPDSFMTPTSGFGTSFSAMNGFGVGNDPTRQLNGSSTSQLAYAFRRAPGFFDVVCYTGTGANRTVAHNLGVAPELMIVKSRGPSARSWSVYAQPIGASNFLSLQSANATATNTGMWNSTDPTSSVFSLGTATTNQATDTYVAYLFATLAGVSKVGSYTGTGTTQQINCGFTSGARFVLIKRTNTTGDWWVFDTARGIVTGNDPFLRLNTTDEETSADYIDTYSAGFELSSTAPAELNGSGDSFIFLAIA